MKTIFFGKKDGQGHVPFWQPWGYGGCLGRLLFFLVSLLLMILLLWLIRGCDKNGKDGEQGKNDPVNIVNAPTPKPNPSPKPELPKDPYKEPEHDDRPPVNPDTPIDDKWKTPIEGGEDVGLPKPEDNKVPPFEKEKTIPDPENGGISDVYANLLYVILDSEENDEAFKTFAQKFTSLYKDKCEIECYNKEAKTILLRVPENERMDICNKLPQQIPEVKFLCVPIEVMGFEQAGNTIPNDPVLSDSNSGWYFKPIQLFEAWDITQGSSDVIVGIVDSYMDLRHEELNGNRILYPYSIPNQNADVAPKSGVPMAYAAHGTFVTSVAVGNANNGKGTAGIAPKCKYIPVSMGNQFTTFHIVEGLLYCMYHGADVINISAGLDLADEVQGMSVDEQIKVAQNTMLAQEKMWDYVFSLAEKHNTVIVFANGNSNIFGALDPGDRNAGTLRVAAVDRNLHKADFSNFGNFKNKNIYESTISAPGVDIIGATPNNTYNCWPGTSFSAPIIAGTVALMKSLNGNLTAKEIISILQETGKDVEGAPEIGKLVQIKDALLKVKGQVPDFNKDINSLLGVWESTQLLRVSRGGKPTGYKAKLRFEIKDTKSGFIHVYVTRGDTATAPITVTQSGDKFILKMTQKGPYKHDKVVHWEKAIYIFSPDKDGKTQCQTTELNGDKRGYIPFNVRKIS